MTKASQHFELIKYAIAGAGLMEGLFKNTEKDLIAHGTDILERKIPGVTAINMENHPPFARSLDNYHTLKGMGAHNLPGPVSVDAGVPVQLPTETPSLAHRVGESVGNIFYSPKIRKALGLGAGIGGVAAGSGVIGHELGERDGTDKGLHMGYNAGRSQAENALSKQDLWDRIKGIFAGNKDVVSKLPRPTP